MNEIIKITTQQVAGKNIATCNARDLWKFVESKQEFAHWIKARIEKYDFVEGSDYLVDKIINQYNQVDRIDYHLTIDTAKELAMVENNAKGREVRRYFIDCERRAEELSKRDPLEMLNDPAAMRGILLNYTERVLSLEENIKTLAPKAEALDRLATVSEGAVCLRIAAKLAQVPEKKFIQIANAEGFIFRNHHSSTWQGYSDKAKAGLVEQKITKIERNDGTDKTVEQVLITHKGLAKLTEIIAKKYGANTHLRAA